MMRSAEGQASARDTEGRRRAPGPVLDRVRQWGKQTDTRRDTSRRASKCSRVRPSAGAGVRRRASSPKAGARERMRILAGRPARLSLAARRLTAPRSAPARRPNVVPERARRSAVAPQRDGARPRPRLGALRGVPADGGVSKIAGRLRPEASTRGKAFPHRVAFMQALRSARSASRAHRTGSTRPRTRPASGRGTGRTGERSTIGPDGE